MQQATLTLPSLSFPTRPVLGARCPPPALSRPALARPAGRAPARRCCPPAKAQVGDAQAAPPATPADDETGAR